MKLYMVLFVFNFMKVMFYIVEWEYFGMEMNIE